jgi:MFS transporter, YNFM family, putative membrane transport protein
MRWRYQETVLTLCTLAFFITTMGRLAISPIVPEIGSTYSVSNAAIGLALTGMWFAYGLAQYPSGLLADRFGERQVILLSVGGSVVAILGIAISPVFALFFLGTVLLGGVAGLHYSVATTLLARTYDNVGTAIGVHNSGATAAGLLAPVVVVGIAIQFGWRVSIASIAILGALVVVVFAQSVRPTEPQFPRTPIRNRFQISKIHELLARPSIAFTLVIATTAEFTWQATASFLPTFLIEHHSVSAPLAASLFSAYFIVQAVGQIGIGALSDRVGRDRTIAGCMLAGVAGFGMLVSRSEFLFLIIGVVFLGVAMSFAAALLPRFLRDFTPEEENTGLGLVRTTYMIVASSGSLVIGVFADLFGWAVSFGFLAMLLAATFLALLINRLGGSKY